MIKRIKTGEADGVIIHKIDRGTRNYRDWADLGDLIDAGKVVHVAEGDLDLLSRGGRLAADVQVVFATDFIRNLRNEVRKGIHGRLKQGLYPFAAPIGYLDMGGGKPKVVDPIRGPLIRQAFELYASGRFTIDSLLAELTARGLRTRGGRPLQRSRIANLLRDSFYTGLIELRTGDSYNGVHEALVPLELFRRVRARLEGRIRSRGWAHEFVFRGVFTCGLCSRYLVGELQKGRVYYRCHTRGCPTMTFREDVLEQIFCEAWPSFAPTDEWKARLRRRLETVIARDYDDGAARVVQLKAQIGLINERLGRLVDATVDGLLDKEAFSMRQRTLLEERQGYQNALTSPEVARESTEEFILGAFELACSAQQSYGLASVPLKRELVLKLSSNRSARGNQASIEPYIPLQRLIKRDHVLCGAPIQDATRTCDRVARDFLDWGKRELAKGADPNQFVKLQKMIEASEAVDLNPRTQIDGCTETPQDDVRAA
jgi:hypothetical protein